DVHHVGMYVGDHKFIHAPHTGDVVKVSDLREPYYAQQFYMGRRIAPEDASVAAAAPPPVAVPEPAVAAAPHAASIPIGSGAQAGHEDFAGLPELKQAQGGPAHV